MATHVLASLFDESKILFDEILGGGSPISSSASAYIYLVTIRFSHL